MLGDGWAGDSLVEDIQKAIVGLIGWQWLLETWTLDEGPQTHPRVMGFWKIL